MTGRDMTGRDITGRDVTGRDVTGRAITERTVVPADPDRRRPEVVVYTRVGCGLCRRAEDLVAREAARAHVRHVDVDTAEELVTRFGVRVPVVTVDGAEVAELELVPGTVRRAVRAARRARRSRALGPPPPAA